MLNILVGDHWYLNYFQKAVSAENKLKKVDEI
jgi:hypothetical protein